MNEYQSEVAREEAEEAWVTTQYELFHEALSNDDDELADDIISKLALTGHSVMASEFQDELAIHVNARNKSAKEDSECDEFIEQQALEE